MKLNEKYIVILTVSVILIAVSIWIWYENKTVDFHLEEYFADSSYNGMINFSFVSVDKYDTEQMLEFAKKIAHDNQTLDMLRRDLPIITVVHFYRKKDSSELDDKMVNQIKRQYPHINDVRGSLQQIPSGYIYTGFSKYIHNLKLPKDTIFQTSVIVPKYGIRAKDILKSNRAKKNANDIEKLEKDTLRN